MDVTAFYVLALSELFGTKYWVECETGEQTRDMGLPDGQSRVTTLFVGQKR